MVSIARVRSTASEGLKVIDVDGSYLPRKHEQLKQAGVQLAPLSPPPIPPGGWEVVTKDNHRDMAKKMPVVLLGRLPSSLPPHMHMHIQTLPSPSLSLGCSLSFLSHFQPVS